MGNTWTRTSLTHSEELVPVKRRRVQNGRPSLSLVQKVLNINEVPNEILDRIFRLLEQESLRQTRLVCTKWEDVALNIMSQSPGKVNLSFIKNAGIHAKGLENIGKLQSILHSSKYPGMFFTELYLESPVFGAYNGVLVREMSLLNLLQNFGSTLKCLKLEGIALHLSIFRPLIEKWCANLEELSFFHLTVIEDDSVNVHDFETLPKTPLNLNLRKFTFRDESYQEPEKNLILSIIKNSPKLQVLKANVPPEEPDLWGKIHNLDHITKNLEELKIEINDAEDFSLISGISLSDKFRSFTLDIYRPLFPKEQLITFLQRVGESLERLSLHLNIDDDEEDEALWKGELPLMNKLKVLKYKSGCEIRFQLQPMDFLEKLPSLEMFRFEGPDYCLGFLEAEHVDAWFRNCLSLTRRPHETLNTLSIIGSPKSPETIASINRMFPNLRELSLVLDGIEMSNETAESCFIRVFQEFSEMKNLKILSINFRDCFEKNAGINFQTCFSPLEASQSLEKLKMFSDIRRACCPAMYFPPGLEKIFAKIPKLKVLTLEGWQINKLSDARNLFKTLDQKGITINLL